MTARWWVPQVPRSQTYTPTRNKEELATIENGGLRRRIERSCPPERRSLAAAAYHPLSVCTFGGRVAVGTSLDGPVRADPQAGAQGLPRSPPTSCHPGPARLCV